MQHFSNISAYCDYMNIPHPAHPQVLVFDLKKDAEILQNRLKTSPPITNDFYLVSMKKTISGNYFYGRTQYDFQKGLMLFTSPNQVLAWENAEIDNSGYAITFHKDFLKGHALNRQIKEYHFFNYSVNESLHLSPKEEETIESIYLNLYKEYHANPDDFSKSIMLAHIDTLLQYCNRFYNRQFIHRKELNQSTIKQFNLILREYMKADLLTQEGIPTVQWMAENLKMTQRYLNDLLKKETSKTASELIQLFLIDEAKNRILAPNASISQVAYDLGFEYPAYFSRLFKKKVGISPKKYMSEYTSN